MLLHKNTPMQEITSQIQLKTYKMNSKV